MASITPGDVWEGVEVLRSVAMALVLCAGMMLVLPPGARAELPMPDSRQALLHAKDLNQLPPIKPHGRVKIDHSGRKEKGKASYYASRFAHRRMADGKRFNPQSNVAASKTLPLGTTAKVVNLANGKSATVKVEDRGPFIDGRVVDVTPKVARQLGMKKQGVAPVVVKPIAVPQPDGNIKLGAGAADLPPQKLQQATRTTAELAHGKQLEEAAK